MIGAPRAHLPARPTWRCRRCGQPWPCGDARAALTVEYRGARPALAVYLACALADALDDLYRLGVDTSGAHAQFLGWLRARSGPADAPQGHEHTGPQE
ncbi:hypothetical protein [Micromonospora sp. NPDC049891]|uniref:hypothetical protein n=1 Tax=Micromonospora sp. NPDC049891 TaxID=3155655 RepID=UPI0033F3094D